MFGKCNAISGIASFPKSTNKLWDALVLVQPEMIITSLVGLVLKNASVSELFIYTISVVLHPHFNMWRKPKLDRPTVLSYDVTITAV